MFQGFAGVWTPVVKATEIRERPVATQVAGEQLVLFRSGSGTITTLIDRCPHRGVALSKGCVTASGDLQCPFHGWEFGGDGTCRHIPLNDLALEKRQRAHALALPTRVAGGLVWIFTGPGATAFPELSVPEALTDSRWVLWHHSEVWDCHWTRAMENMLDMPHVPFLHRRTIGRGLRKRLKRDSRMDVHVEPTAFGMTIRNHVDGTPGAGFLQWWRPNGMALHITPPQGRVGLRQHLWCVPVDERRTRMVLVSARTFGRYNPLVGLFDQFNKLVLLEDRAVVESSQPAMVPPPGDEMSVATDVATLTFRRTYFQDWHGRSWDLQAGRPTAGA